METKAVDKHRSSWPTLFDNGWMEKFFNAPLDEFFNMGKVMNVPAVNVSETENEFRLTVAAPGMEKNDFKIEAYDDMLTISAEKKMEETKEKKAVTTGENTTTAAGAAALPFLKTAMLKK